MTNIWRHCKQCGPLSSCCSLYHTQWKIKCYYYVCLLMSSLSKYLLHTVCRSSHNWVLFSYNRKNVTDTWKEKPSTETKISQSFYLFINWNSIWVLTAPKISKAYFNYINTLPNRWEAVDTSSSYSRSRFLLPSVPKLQRKTWKFPLHSVAMLSLYYDILPLLYGYFAYVYIVQSESKNMPVGYTF